MGKPTGRPPGRPPTTQAPMHAQNYRVRREVCKQCLHYRFRQEPKPWVVKLWPEDPARWEKNMMQAKKRCGIGNFSVKPTATCDLWEPNPELDHGSTGAGEDADEEEHAQAE